MEALWNLEDKWKLTTQEAVGLFACTAFVVIGLCTATILKKKKKKKDRQKQILELERESVPRSTQIDWSEQNCHWIPVKNVLMDSVRWCGANKWGEGERQPPLLDLRRYEPGVVGWQSHNSDSPVWQRPILMGEKCQLPSFSGLILYDERGQLLDHSIDESSHNEIALQEKPVGSFLQEKPTAVVKTMLKDLL